MNKNIMLAAAVVLGLFYLLGRQAKAAEARAPLGQFSDYSNIYNPNGGTTKLYNYNGGTNGGYGGALGNLADGNPYSIGL